MLNAIEVYIEAGRKAAAGVNRGDEGFAKHWREWARKAIALEQEGDKQKAVNAFHAAYMQARRY